MDKEKAFAFASVSTLLFIAWGATTICILYLAGEILNYGAIILMFVNPLNWIAHSVIRSKNGPAFQWKGFSIYLLCLHFVILGVGIFVEEDWVGWAYEVS